MGKRNGGDAAACMRNEEQHDTNGDEREMAGRRPQINRLDVWVRGRACCIENYGYLCVRARICAWISASAKRTYKERGRGTDENKRKKTANKTGKEETQVMPAQKPKGTTKKRQT
jgi:hypothetical protein